MSSPNESINKFGPKDLPLVSQANRDRANSIVEKVNSISPLNPGGNIEISQNYHGTTISTRAGLAQDITQLKFWGVIVDAPGGSTAYTDARYYVQMVGGYDIHATPSASPPSKEDGNIANFDLDSGGTTIFVVTNRYEIPDGGVDPTLQTHLLEIGREVHCTLELLYTQEPCVQYPPTIYSYKDPNVITWVMYVPPDRVGTYCPIKDNSPTLSPLNPDQISDLDSHINAISFHSDQFIVVNPGDSDDGKDTMSPDPNRALVQWYGMSVLQPFVEDEIVFYDTVCHATYVQFDNDLDHDPPETYTLTPPGTTPNAYAVYFDVTGATHADPCATCTPTGVDHVGAAIQGTIFIPPVSGPVWEDCTGSLIISKPGTIQLEAGLKGTLNLGVLQLSTNINFASHDSSVKISGPTVSDCGLNWDISITGPLFTSILDCSGMPITADGGNRIIQLDPGLVGTVTGSYPNATTIISPNISFTSSNSSVTISGSTTGCELVYNFTVSGPSGPIWTDCSGNSIVSGPTFIKLDTGLSGIATGGGIEISTNISFTSSNSSVTISGSTTGCGLVYDFKATGGVGATGPVGPTGPAGTTSGFSGSGVFTIFDIVNGLVISAS